MLPRLAKSNAAGGSAAQRSPRVRGAAYPRPGRRASLHSRVLMGEDSAFKPSEMGAGGRGGCVTTAAYFSKEGASRWRKTLDKSSSSSLMRAAYQTAISAVLNGYLYCTEASWS